MPHLNPLAIPFMVGKWPQCHGKNRANKHHHGGLFWPLQWGLLSSMYATGCNYSTGFRAPQATGTGFNCKLCTPSVTYPLEEQCDLWAGSPLHCLSWWSLDILQRFIQSMWKKVGAGATFPGAHCGCHYVWFTLYPTTLFFVYSTIKLMILSLGSRCPLHWVKSPLNWFDIRNKGLLSFSPPKTTFFHPSAVPSMAAHHKGAELPYQTHPAHKCGAVSDLWSLRQPFYDT